MSTALIVNANADGMEQSESLLNILMDSCKQKWPSLFIALYSNNVSQWHYVCCVVVLFCFVDDHDDDGEDDDYSLCFKKALRISSQMLFCLRNRLQSRTISDKLLPCAKNVFKNIFTF